MIRAIAGLALPILAMWSVFRAARLQYAAHSRLLTLALASCVGIGASSALTFTTLMLGGSLDRGFVWRDASLWVTVAVLSWVVGSRRHRLPPTVAPFPQPTPADWGVRIGFLCVLVIACAVPVVEYLTAPHGQWDAWAIWNQKARFMFRAGPRWTDSVAIPWSQPSHPPLVAASVARLWAYAGAELTAVPAMLSGAFALSILAVVMGALDLRTRRAWVAGAVLVAPWTFTHLAAAQTGDLPVSLFFIATLVMLPMRPAGWRKGFETNAALWLAGATAALAAWTKNEGVVFFAAVTALVIWSSARHGRLGDTRWLIIGALPFLAALAWFKVDVVPQAPEYFGGTNTLTAVFGRLLDTSRQAEIASAIWPLARHWGGPAASGSLFVIAGLAIGMATRPAGRVARGFLAVAFTMAVGYLVVYLLTPLDVTWLVQTTFERLTLQVWPILVCAACAPAETDGARQA